MATPHISAEKGDFAKTVLMPGDPLRAKFIADTFLKDVRQVTGVRGMLGFTGTYEGRPTGNHCHFEIRLNGSYIPPQNVFPGKK